jgi:RNA polymerase sigma-70 factor (ECF subfamily)
MSRSRSLLRRARAARSQDFREGCRFRASPAQSLGTAAVLAVVYVIVNEGYGGRVDLAAAALRLGGALAELMPDEPEVHGLLAMMALHDARLAADRRALREPG